MSPSDVMEFIRPFAPVLGLALLAWAARSKRNEIERAKRDGDRYYGDS